MEDQIAGLAAQVAAMEAKGNLTNTMFAEAYYYLTIPLMVIIHAGFWLKRWAPPARKTRCHPA